MTSTIDSKCVNGRRHFSRKENHPLRNCVRCLYVVGYGMTFISKHTGKNKGILHRWVKQAGVKRDYIKSSRPINPRKTAQNELEFRKNLATAIRISRKMFWKSKESKLSDAEKRKIGRQYYQRNKDRIRLWRRKKSSEPVQKFIRAMRQRTWKTIVHQGGEKRHSWTGDLLGCTRQEFMNYLQAQFVGKMAWNNYGSYWEVDHIIPCNAFDLTRDDEQRRCFHFTNLRPLTKSQNRRKSWLLTNPQQMLPL